MKIHGLNKTTLLDYPGLVAATVFTGGCNFRCQFCQNSSLILNPDGEPTIPEDEFFSFLNKRKGVIKGVCITGGEPTLDPDLISFIAKIKSLGFRVKLDTNGSRPELLKTLIDRSLIDMAAMDIKGPLEDYPAISGVPGLNLSGIQESVSILMDSGKNNIIDYEFRTTVCAQLFCEESFHKIGKWIQGAKSYYLQCFQDSDMVLTSGLTAPSREDMEKYREIMLAYVPNTSLRGL